MKTEKILSQLMEKQRQYALEALLRPQGKTEFDFGQIVGTVQGYQHAIDEITAVYKEESSINDFD